MKNANPLWLVLAGSLALGLLACSGESLWLDEAWMARIAAESTLAGWWERMRELGGSSLQMPLYTLYLWVWEKLAGQSEWMLRAANIPFFVLGQWALFRSLREEKALALWTALVVGASPFMWSYLAEARPYAMQFGAACLVVAGLVQLTRAKPFASRDLFLFCARARRAVRKQRAGVSVGRDGGGGCGCSRRQEPHTSLLPRAQCDSARGNLRPAACHFRLRRVGDAQRSEGFRRRHHRVAQSPFRRLRAARIRRASARGASNCASRNPSKPSCLIYFLCSRWRSPCLPPSCTSAPCRGNSGSPSRSTRCCRCWSWSCSRGSHLSVCSAVISCRSRRCSSSRSDMPRRARLHAGTRIVGSSPSG